MESDYKKSVNHRNALKSTGYYFIRLSFGLGVFWFIIFLILGIPLPWALLLGLVIWKITHWFLWVVYRRANHE